MDPAIVDTILFLAAGIIAAVVVHFVFIFLKKQAEKTETMMDDLIVHSLGAPLTILAFFIPFFFAIHHLIDLYPEYQWIADANILLSAYVIVGTWIVATFLDDFLRIYGTALAETTETDLDDRIVEILQKIGKYFIWFIGILYILTLYSVNITPLIAGAGVVGIAIALAAQDLFSNFFGGAVIITDQPFKVGDRVLINDVLGDVTHIGPRSTRLLTLDKDVVSIPNTKIATSVVHNYSLPNPQVRIQIPVTVSNSEDITRIKRVLGEICDEAVKGRPDLFAHDPSPTVYLMQMDKSTITFQITVYAAGFQYDNIIQDYMNVRIIERFRKEEIPFC
ncbi:MAG: mechanosensitive ion channel family protein [Methanoregula sp.]|uniref:mechanosensitive ion channel family protein n=1 Tax=Methanoregula sp. TaxID=2052170 RepID=UPI003D0FE4C2